MRGKVDMIPQIEIDGSQIYSLNDFYRILADQLQWPPHFGRNWDAVWDLLTTETPGPMTIVFKKSNLLAERMPEEFRNLIRILKTDLPQIRPDIRVVLE